MTTAHDHLANGHADTPPKAVVRPGFLVNQRFERLLRLRETDPKTYAVFGPETVTALGFYEENRTAANYHPKETTDGDDD